MENLLRNIGKTADRIGYNCYVVGGFVRDKLLGLENDDIDVVVVGSGIKMAEEFAKDQGAPPPTTYPAYGTAMTKVGDIEVEFVGARKESYQRGSRNPIVEEGTLEDDLRRRDLTINAMAICLNKEHFGEVVDIFSGQEDLEKGILRTPIDPTQTFTDDPLRMLRTARFMCKLGFRIEENTWNAIKICSGGVKILVPDRIATELNKILSSPRPGQGIGALQATGILRHIIPELSDLYIDGAGHKNNFKHSVKVLSNVSALSDNLWLRWAALLHDVGKGPTEVQTGPREFTYHGHEYVGSRMCEDIFRRLHLPTGHELKYVQHLVEMHMRPSMIETHSIGDSAVRRLLFDAGPDINDLMILCRSDLTTANDQKRTRILQHFDRLEEMMEELKAKDQKRLFQPVIGGKEIMEILGIGQGRQVGIIKDFLKNAILDGELENDAEVLERVVREKFG